MAKYVSDKMRDMPMLKLILTMSIPAMLSMLVKALYNIVDSLYISSYDPAGLDALSIVFPLQTIVIAMSIGIAVGATTLVSRRLGEGKREEANNFAMHGLFLAIIGSIIMIIIGLVFPRTFMSWFTNDLETIQMGVDYLKICLCFSFGVFIEICLTRTLQATGNMKVPMISQILGAVINIILDPVFIFGFWFIPEMGAAGAAIATVIGQVISMIYVVVVFLVKKHDIHLSFKNFKPKLEYLKQISKIGLPTFVMNSIASFTTTILNFILKAYAYAITIQGIYFKVRSFIFMPVFGLTQGLMPIMSYNYGSQDYNRFKKARKIGLTLAISIMAVGNIAFFALTPQILQMFNFEDPVAVQMGIYGLRVLSLNFIFSGIGITISTSYQSIGKNTRALIMSLCRQIIFLIPLAWLLSNFTGYDGVFFCYVIAEALVAIIFTPLHFKQSRKCFIQKATA